MVYPFVLGGISVLGAVLGILFVNVRSNSAKADRVLMAAWSSPAWSPPSSSGRRPQAASRTAWTSPAKPSPRPASTARPSSGLLMTGAVVVITNYYTSMPTGRCAASPRLPRPATPPTSSPASRSANTPPRCRCCFIVAAILLQLSWPGLFGIAIAVMSHAQHGRHHHLARCLRPDHRQRRRHRRHERPARRKCANAPTTSTPWATP